MGKGTNVHGGCIHFIEKVADVNCCFAFLGLATMYVVFFAAPVSGVSVP